MVTWIMENIANIIIVLILLLVVAGIILVMIRDKKKGVSSCGGNCGHCPMSGSCHNK
ncbi:MAG: FeoB-associated Cys-rich membrane protein [Lachnospiraceae bacterium]|nr:FeoB-associated Cys-rich membrane protein [Lachnospiraceae bacterium]